MARRIPLTLALCLFGNALAGGSAGTAFTLNYTWTAKALTLNVKANPSKRIDAVEFWDGHTLLRKITAAPYRLTVETYGCHDYYARIYYDNAQVAVKTFKLKYCADPPPAKP